jgi:hypothetical protein
MVKAAKDPNALSWELRDEVEKALKRAAFELNGHWKNGAAIDKGYLADVLKHVMLGRDTMSEADAVAIVRAREVGKPMDRWVPVC